jgi:hypothetical protein
MGLHEIQKILHNIRNGHQVEEAAYRIGENLYHLHTWQVINKQNIQGAQKTKL